MYNDTPSPQDRANLYTSREIRVLFRIPFTRYFVATFEGYLYVAFKVFYSSLLPCYYFRLIGNPYEKVDTNTRYK